MLNIKLIGVVSAAFVAFALAGCDKEEMEASKQSLQDTAAKVSETVSAAADSTGAALDSAADSTTAALSSAADKAGDMASDASDKVHAMSD